MRKSYNSRLEKHLESQTKKYIFYTVLGVIVLIIILVKFGIPIVLGTSSLFNGNSQSNQSSEQSNQVTFVSAPILKSIPSATKDNAISISGTAQSNVQIQLYNNNKLVDKTDSASDGSFSFVNETLSDGANSFTAKAIKNNKQSDYSNQVSINYRSKPPSLTLDSPADNATFSKDQNPITVSGTTDSYATVTVNGNQATIDGNGKYNYVLNLQNGGGLDIKVEATDDAGNTIDKQIHITYNP